MEESRKKIEKCCYSFPDINTEQMKVTYICMKNDSATTKDKCECCNEYKSRYIEYPIQVNEIQNHFSVKNELHKGYKGKLVKIRPCGDEYKGKTFLGIYLGDLPVGAYVSFQEDEGILNISAEKNPAIFIPEIKKIIYGYESWWGIINDEAELKDISDKEIEEVWYMRLLREMYGEVENGTGD